jgi:hypothetical protein
MRTTILAILTLSVLALLGCGGSPETMQATGTGDIPAWYPAPPQDADFIRAANSQVSQDMQLAVDKATTGARTELGRILEVKVNGLQKKFEEETGVGDQATLLQQFTQASKTVVSTSLTGSRMKDQKTLKDGTMWRAYVMMELPIGAANAALLDAIKKNNELYTRFRASEAYKDLDSEVQKYEQYKQQQQGK